MNMQMRGLYPLFIFAAYFGIAALITYPLVLRMGEAFAGFPYGDAYENARHMWWMTHALRTGQPLFFQPLLAYPDGLPGLTLQATPLLLFPGWLFALALPLPSAYNLHVLLMLALNGWAMHGFARALTGRRDAAFLAGVIFLSYPTLQGHLGASHLNILAQWGVPLYAWGLWRLGRDVGTHNGASVVASAIWVAAAFVAVAWAHTIQVIYTLLPITAFFAIRALLRRDLRALLRIVLAAGAGAGLTLLWLLPVFFNAFSSTYVDEGGSVRYSADLLAAITPSFFHPFWGNLPHTRAVLGVNLDEGAGYVGLIAGLLALVGIWRRRDARSWLWLALVAYVLALGPLLKWNDQPLQFMTDGNLGTIALPWALLERLPGFELARTPGRFNLTTGFAIAVMAALGAAWGLAHMRRRALRAVLVAACAGLILFDYQTFFPLPTTRADIPQAILDLREREDVRAVFDVPWDNLLAAKDALYLQTAHQHPMVAGHVTRRTPVDPAMLTILESTLDPALLNDAGADIIVLHKSYVDETERARLIAALGEPFYEDERFALFERPESQNTPDFTTIVGDHAIYWYAPVAGWAMLEGRIEGEGEVTLHRTPAFSPSLTSRLLGRAHLETLFWPGSTQMDTPLRLPITLPAGYSTLRWVADPHCPTHLPPGLRCNTPIVALTLRAFSPGVGRTSIFESGIALTGSRVMRASNVVEIWLAWSYYEPLTPNMIRFVHLLDGEGAMIAQVDSPPNVPGSEGAELITLPLPDDLPPGEYRVVVGWYRLPDVTPILALGADAGATRVEIGSITILSS